MHTDWDFTNCAVGLDTRSTVDGLVPYANSLHANQSRPTFEAGTVVHLMDSSRSNSAAVSDESTCVAADAY